MFQILLFLVFPMRRTSEKKKNVSCFVESQGDRMGPMPEPTAVSRPSPTIALLCFIDSIRRRPRPGSLVLFLLFLSSIIHRRPVFYQSSLIILTLLFPPVYTSIYCDPVSLPPSSDQKSFTANLQVSLVLRLPSNELPKLPVSS